jgi:translation elongation factor EF-G
MDWSSICRGLINQTPTDISGRAVYTMQFGHYAETPESIAEEIVSKVRGV